MIYVFMLSLLWISSISNSMARSVNSEEDSVIAVVAGSFYALEPITGEKQRRISRRHLDVMGNNSSGNSFRLDLGPQLTALDMELSQDSAWNSDSIVVSRRGEEEEQLHSVIDSNCFLSGYLKSHNGDGNGGAVSLNRCGRLYGMAQAGDFHYEIKSASEEEEDSDDSSSKFLNVVVTVRKSTVVDKSADDTINKFQNNRLDRDAEDTFSAMVGDGDMEKRQAVLPPAAVEVAVYLDANFIAWMARNRRKRSAADLTQWIVMKWNIIRRVYANERAIGFPLTIQLKKVELWWTNPHFYAVLGNRSRSRDYINAFCRQTAALPNYDHKMLYSQGTGDHEVGLAGVNGICRRHNKCSWVKGKDEPVKTELHELGHNLGLNHDPDLKPCTNPDGEGGFMGWGSNYRILDCYRRVLRRTVREYGARCLYEVNVPSLPVLNRDP